jgi:hypothetical protein
MWSDIVYDGPQVEDTYHASAGGRAMIDGAGLEDMGPHRPWWAIKFQR